MSDTERLCADANDAELISRVRGGDVDAYGELFARHVDSATRLARTLTGPGDADDLVSEAFVKVLNVLLGGHGPDIAFRAYLLTAVRRLHVDRIRATRKATPTGDLTPFDPGVPFHDTVVSGFEGGAAARAFSSLPERWQMVLWHLEVEGQKPADIAPLLGMSANSVSALAYRAREGLRQAFLQMHTADLVDDDCRWTHDKLGAYVRKGLARRDNDKVERHLDQCRRCTAIYLELAELNTSLAAVIGPLVLGGAAAAYLAGSTAGASGLIGAGALLGRARDFVVGNSQAAIAVGATAGLAAVATAGFLVMQGHSGSAPMAVSDPAAARSAVAGPGTSAPAQRDDKTAGRSGRKAPGTPQQVVPVGVGATTVAAPGLTPPGGTGNAGHPAASGPLLLTTGPTSGTASGPGSSTGSIPVPAQPGGPATLPGSPESTAPPPAHSTPPAPPPPAQSTPPAPPPPVHSTPPAPPPPVHSTPPAPPPPATSPNPPPKAPPADASLVVSSELKPLVLKAEARNLGGATGTLTITSVQQPLVAAKLVLTGDCRPGPDKATQLTCTVLAASPTVTLLLAQAPPSSVLRLELAVPGDSNLADNACTWSTRDQRCS